MNIFVEFKNTIPCKLKVQITDIQNLVDPMDLSYKSHFSWTKKCEKSQKLHLNHFNILQDYLNISFNNLHDLHPKIFSGLTKLFELDASNNELSALPEKLLDDQRELEYVSFTNNQVRLLNYTLKTFHHYYCF